MQDGNSIVDRLRWMVIGDAVVYGLLRDVWGGMGDGRQRTDDDGL